MSVAFVSSSSTHRPPPAARPFSVDVMQRSTRLASTIVLLLPSRWTAPPLAPVCPSAAHRETVQLRSEATAEVQR
eukprot:2120973-Prymnesium_polylepis.1